MASQSPRNHLKTFLEPVASFSQSLGPFRATATPFMPKITESACLPKQYISRKQTLQGGSCLGNSSPSNFFDPSRLLRKPLVYRHFYNRSFTCSTVGELVDSQIFKSVQKPDFWDGHFWGILPEQYIFRTMYFRNKYSFQLYKPAGWIYEPAGWIYEPAGC